MGRRGLIMMIVLMVFLLASLVLPLVAWAAAVAYLASDTLGVPFTQHLLGYFLLFISAGGGVLSGVTGGGRQLAWESYRAYPVRHVTLFMAEIVASLFDLVPLMLSGMVLAHVATLGVVHPRAIPTLMLVAVESLALALIAQTVISSVTAVLLRRLRIAFGLLMLGVAIAALVVVTQLTGPQGPSPSMVTSLVQRITQLRGSLELLAEWLPGTWGIRSVASAIEGRWLDALACHAYPMAVVLIGGFVASRLMAREVASGGIETSAQAARLWTFSAPSVGVARLTLVTLLDSALGRVGLVAPMLTMALVRLPLMRWLGGTLSIPGAYAYIALSTSAIQLNQFGLDGHGIKSLFLLPLSTRDLLHGKTLGLATYYSVQAVLLAVLLWLVQKTPPAELLAGTFLGASFFLTQNTVGRWTSAWLPRRLPRRDMRGTGAPGGIALVSLGLTVSSGASFGGLYVACQRFYPVLLVPVTAAIFGALLIAHRLSANAAARYFEAHRETVLGAIG